MDFEFTEILPTYKIQADWLDLLSFKPNYCKLT